MNQDGCQVYKPKELSKLLNVSNECLRLWSKEGKIKSAFTEGGHRRYIFKDMAVDERKSYIYARVSSHKQKRDLDRQIRSLQQTFPEHEVISDVGSGLNYKRKGFIKILELLFQGNIKELVVAYKDRLSRFGFELFEFMFKRFGSILTVAQGNTIKEPVNEFAEDILSIITVFTARYYGRRKYNRLQKDSDLSNGQTNRVVQQMPRRKPLFLQSSKRFHKIKVSRSHKQIS